MPRISLYPALREHPFGDPATDNPSFVQDHSYIFPGDELLLTHNVALPDMELSTDNIQQVKLVSATASIIAQKPQVFSEEFNPVFKSTRNFVLDSFTTNFDNTNAKYIPYGSDGYAQDVIIQQDRNWKLPVGDLRRQINFFTEHTPSDINWIYRFYFPVIFRWEDWIAKLNTNNDFFDTSLPQNGQNEYWYHYFVLNKWRIVSRLDLNILAKGVPKIVRSQLNLSSRSNSINTYNANTDWINKSIKTTNVGGSPSNAPCFIYGNKDTEVWAYFDKVSGWGGDEQGKISAVIWIEPFKGAGLTARTRASSVYTPDPDTTVFKGVDTSIVDGSGLGILTGGGDYIVTNDNGNGVLVLFNGLASSLEFFALIDHNKLQQFYPGEINFTIYARLYNSTLSGGQTIMGEEIRQNCTLISPPDSNSLCAPREPQCPFNLTVFGDIEDSDDLKNDKSDFYSYADALIASISFTLQKNEDNCGDSWSDVKTFTDSSYGKFFAFGKSPDFKGNNFLDNDGKKYTGLFLEWKTILTEFGVGNYRMKIVKTDEFGNSMTSYDVRRFCLKAYSCNLINGTVRIELNNKGTRGSLDDITAKIDYFTGWNSQVRLRGILMTENKPSYNLEFNEYGDGDNNKFSPVIAELSPKFVLDLKPVPGWMDFYLENHVLLSDEIKITDYNTINTHQFVRLPVKNDGGFESQRQTMQNPLARCKLLLAFGQNSLRKRNS